jgi:hypothetical protein
MPRSTQVIEKGGRREEVMADGQAVLRSRALYRLGWRGGGAVGRGRDWRKGDEEVDEKVR